MSFIDKTGALYIITKIKTLLDAKVNVESGKGLSTNDYTTEEKNKLSGIASGANKYTHPTYTGGASGLYKVTVDATGHVSAVTAVTKADITALGIPAQDTNTTYTDMKGATSSAAGTSGLVPAPASGAQSKFLKGDGTWAVPTNTTYSVMTAATSSEAGTSGLVPAPSAGSQTKFLRGDGTWVTPSNTTYNVATSSANGLMSSTDKAKLDAFGAASTYALKSDITNMYRYKGSVASESKLPTTGLTSGDVYNIVDASSYGPAGQNVAWNGTAWDNLGGLYQIDAVTPDEIDAMFSYDGGTLNIET